MPFAPEPNLSTQEKTAWIAAFLLSLIVAVVGIATLRVADAWSSGDYALYLMHAANLANGRPYSATAFVFNPAHAIMSPAAYPPGLPFLLAPIYRFFGADIENFKAGIVLTHAAIVLFTFHLARLRLSPLLALLAAAFTALAPSFVSMRDGVVSDLPFTAWCLVALVAWQPVMRARHSLAALVLGTLAIYFALVTRTAGVALVAAFCLQAVLKREPGWQAMLLASLLAGALAAATYRWLHVDSGTYVSYFQGGILDVIGSLPGAAVDYVIGISWAIGLSFGKLPNLVCMLALISLCGLGLADLRRERYLAPEIFLVLYIALLLVFPVRAEKTRYLVPVLPVLACLALRGAVVLGRHRMWLANPRGLKGFCFGLLIICLITLPGYRIRNPISEPADSPASPASQAMLAAVVANVPADEVVLTWNPRVVAWFTGRRAGIWPEQVTEANFRDSLARLGARFVLTRETPDRADELAVRDILARCQDIVPIYHSAGFTLYQVGAASG